MKNKFYISNGHAKTKSTLLIPTDLVEILRVAQKKYGSFTQFFHSIVHSKHPVYKKKISGVKSSRIAYQSSGLNLQRVDFTPLEEDWEMFRIYAYEKRISMTLLFVLVLMNWGAFEERGGGVPVVPTKTQWKLTLSIFHHVTYIEFERLIV